MVQQGSETQHAHHLPLRFTSSYQAAQSLTLPARLQVLPTLAPWHLLNPPPPPRPHPCQFKLSLSFGELHLVSLPSTLITFNLFSKIVQVGTNLTMLLLCQKPFGFRCPAHPLSLSLHSTPWRCERWQLEDNLTASMLLYLLFLLPWKQPFPPISSRTHSDSVVFSRKLTLNLQAGFLCFLCDPIGPSACHPLCSTHSLLCSVEVLWQFLPLGCQVLEGRG